MKLFCSLFNRESFKSFYVVFFIYFSNSTTTLVLGVGLHVRASFFIFVVDSCVGNAMQRNALPLLRLQQHCEIPPKCEMQSELWNLANYKFFGRFVALSNTPPLPVPTPFLRQGLGHGTLLFQPFPSNTTDEIQFSKFQNQRRESLE